MPHRLLPLVMGSLVLGGLAVAVATRKKETTPSEASRILREQQKKPKGKPKPRSK
jgi:hypothetical protein